MFRFEGFPDPFLPKLGGGALSQMDDGMCWPHDAIVEAELVQASQLLASPVVGSLH